MIESVDMLRNCHFCISQHVFYRSIPKMNRVPTTKRVLPIRYKAYSRHRHSATEALVIRIFILYTYTLYVYFILILHTYCVAVQTSGLTARVKSGCVAAHSCTRAVVPSRSSRRADTYFILYTYTVYVLAAERTYTLHFILILYTF